jgi:hypothetical protein
VIGARLDGLDGIRIGDRETRTMTLVKLLRSWRREKAGHSPNFLPLRKRLQPFDFDVNPVAYEAVFGEMDAQAFDFGCVASVKRRKCGKCGKGHVFG